MEENTPRGLSGRIPRRFFTLCAVDFSARTSYNMARTPILPLYVVQQAGLSIVFAGLLWSIHHRNECRRQAADGVDL